MTLTYGFYDSVTGDRVYNAMQMSSIFDGIIRDGVFSTIGDKLMVSPNTGMTVVVGSGRAWFNHTWSYNDADVSIVLSTADALLPRIDVIYLEINSDSGVRANSFNVLTGTPASTPVAPTLTNTATVHQYALAHIYVGAGVTTISQAAITNKVGLTPTPFVTGPLEIFSSTTLIAQWEAEFDTWFDAMKDQLTTDAAGNLQTQLNEHDHVGGAGAQIPTSGIEDLAVTAAKIANGTITGSKIASGTIMSSNISANGVTADNIIGRARSVWIPAFDNNGIGHAMPATGYTVADATFSPPSDCVGSIQIYPVFFATSTGVVRCKTVVTYMRMTTDTWGHYQATNATGLTNVSVNTNGMYAPFYVGMSQYSQNNSASPVSFVGVITFERDGDNAADTAGSIQLLGWWLTYTADM